MSPPRHLAVRAAASILAVGLAVTACSHSPPVASPAPAPLRSPCPDAAFVPTEAPHPGRVEVENRTGSDVRIVIDRCMWWTRLGIVRAGRTAYLRLPRRLLRYGQGMRFHAFTESPNRWYGAFTSDFDVPLAHLVVSPETALTNVTEPDSLHDEGSAAPAVISRVMDGSSYVSVFSSDSYAVLTWRCTLEGGPELALASGGRLASDPSVTLSLGSGEIPFGRWSLIRAFTDGAAAPEAVVAPFTEAIRRAPAATLVVAIEGEDGRRYDFDTGELDAALAALPCMGH